MSNQTVNIPFGANSAKIIVLDAQGNDITSTCTLTATSSDPTVVAIGTPGAGAPNVIPFTALKENASCTITYVAVNASGQIQEVDTVNVVVPAPASMSVTYSSTVVTPPASGPSAAPAAAPAA